ncbi:hypothetical protein L1887_61780 [Cichorium endivia]|nr:hypothetical protein L1887_61780 [Cichorium endivia]
MSRRASDSELLITIKSFFKRAPKLEDLIWSARVSDLGESERIGKQSRLVARLTARFTNFRTDQIKRNINCFINYWNSVGQFDEGAECSLFIHFANFFLLQIHPNSEGA